MSDGGTVPVAVLGQPGLLLTSLVTALRSCGHRAVLCGGDGAPAAEPPGVLIVDVLTPRAVDAIPAATAAGWKVIAVGPRTCTDGAAAAVVAGAQAWVGTEVMFAELVVLVSAAQRGGLQMDDAERTRWREVHGETEAERTARTERLGRLSRREQEVLRLLAEGKRAADVADELFLALATVRTHIRSILVKLEVNAQEAAIAIFREPAGD